MHDYARKAVTGYMTALRLHKNEVGGYTYNDAAVLCKHINRVMERQCFEETADVMKGLKDDTPNVLTEMKAGVVVTKAAVLKASRDKAATASTSSITFAPEIGKDDAREEADRQNTFCHAVIGMKEAVAEGITALIGEAITNSVLWAADGSEFRGVDEYELHQLYTAIMEGAARPEATNIRRKYVDLAGTMFNFRDTFAVNFERLAAAAMKFQGFEIVVHDDLTANILMANADWAAGSLWGNGIRVAYHNKENESRFKKDAARRRKKKKIKKVKEYFSKNSKHLESMNDDEIFDFYITQAEDKKQ